MKYSLARSLSVRCLCGAALCTSASLPPTLQFFSEVFVVSESGLFRFLLVLPLFVYIFMGGLIPVFLLGSLLTRHYSVGLGPNFISGFLCSVLFLVILSFSLFLVI